MDPWSQSLLIAYDQTRQYEEADEAATLAGAKLSAQL